MTSSFSLHKHMFSDSSRKQVSSGITNCLNLGQLETNQFTNLLIDMSGQDDEAEFIEEIVDEVIKEEEGGVRRNVDGVSFVIFGFEDVDEYNEEPKYVVTIRRQKQWDSHNAATISTTMLTQEEKLNACRKLVRLAFECMKENVSCSACKCLLSDSSKTYCSDCLEYWNCKGCTICKKRIGRMKDGICANGFSSCAKRNEE